MKARFLRTRTLSVAVATVSAATLWGAITAEAVGQIHWLTGTQLQKQLAAPVGISWTDNPLRKALESLSQSQRVAVLIDRRVDPGRPMDLHCDNIPLETVLHEVARRRELSMSLLGPVAYFGPQKPSKQLRTIAKLREEEIRRLPTTVQRTFLLPKPIAWDDFATPRDLLAGLAEQNDLSIEGTNRVPHDLWAAADLPPISLVDRLTLILVQFDLTFQVDPEGKTISLVPLPDKIAITRDYSGGTDPQATAERLARLMPAAEIKVADGRVYVTGLLEDHELLTSSRTPPDKPADESAPPDLDNLRLTWRVEEQTVGGVLEDLAKQLQFELKIDLPAIEEAGLSLETRISLSVDGATIDQLLREVVKSAGLEFHRRDRTVEVFPVQ